MNVIQFKDYFNFSQEKQIIEKAQPLQIAEQITFIVLKIISYITLIFPIICGFGLLAQRNIAPSTPPPDHTAAVVDQVDVLKGAKLPNTFQQILERGEELDGQYRSGKIKKVYRPINSPWVIKEWKGALKVPAFIATDILFYQASKQLDLRVVPKIRYIAPDSANFQSIVQKYPKISPILVQAYIEEDYAQALDIQHAQEVVLFNWIMGRQDCKRENSAVDGNGKVWEIDNDSPGNIYSLKETFRDHSWLERQPTVMTNPLSEEIIDKILQLPRNIKLGERLIPISDAVKGRKRNIEEKLNQNLSILKGIIFALRRAAPHAPISLKVISEKIESEISRKGI